MQGYRVLDRMSATETCEVRMKFLIFELFLYMGSIPITSTIYAISITGSTEYRLYSGMRSNRIWRTFFLDNLEWYK